MILRFEGVALGLAGLCCACAPFMPANWIALLIWVQVATGLALGLNIVVGQCKLLDLGYAGFVAIGAYTTAILLTKFEWGFWSSALLSVVLACVAGMVFGWPTLRLHGDYFAIVTFGFSELIILVVKNWPQVTNGSLGIGGIPAPQVGSRELTRYPPLEFFYLGALLLTLVYLFCRRLAQSRLGRQMTAVGDDAILASACGIDVTAVKTTAFALSAAIAGLWGAFWASYFQFVACPDFSLQLSIQILAIVIVARSPHVNHIIAAGCMLAPLAELLRRSLNYVHLPDSSRFALFGLILVLFVISRNRRAP